MGIFYHLIKLKVQGFSICVLISLNYMNLGGFVVGSFFLSIACECCKTPPVLEWKVHSVACCQVNKAVKCRSKTEGLKLQ